MKQKIASTHSNYVARCELTLRSHAFSIYDSYYYYPCANYCSALEVGASSERRARYSTLHDRSEQKFRDFLNISGMSGWNSHFRYIIPGISGIVGRYDAQRMTALVFRAFPWRRRMNRGLKPPNPPPGSGPDHHVYQSVGKRSMYVDMSNLT